jgi:hypothetical protein
MPGDLIFLYSIEPRTVEVRIQINGTSVLLLSSEPRSRPDPVEWPGTQPL